MGFNFSTPPGTHSQIVLVMGKCIVFEWCSKVTPYCHSGITEIFLYMAFSVWDELSTVKEPLHFYNLISADSTALKDHLIDELDYNLVTKDAWFKLVSWYGVLSEEQALPRKVVEHGMYVKSCKVEVYLMQLKLCQHSDQKTTVTRQFSKGDTVGRLWYLIYTVYEINSWNFMYT